MATILTHPRFPPAAAGRIAANLLNRHSPHEIAEAIEVLVDVLDFIDGDPDHQQANGDELDGTDAEDEILHDFGLNGMGGPGCPISDPPENDDHGEDGADAEIETWSHPDDHPAELWIGKRLEPRE